MSYTPKYIKGDWKAICDVCGFLYRASQLKKRWDGYWVCEADYETRHPQDFLRSVRDDQSVPWTRPEPTNTFVTSTYCPLGQSAKAGVAVVGCALVGSSAANISDNNTVPSGTFNNEL